MKNDISDALRKNDELQDIRNTIEEMILKSHLCNKTALTVIFHIILSQCQCFKSIDPHPVIEASYMHAH